MKYVVDAICIILYQKMRKDIVYLKEEHYAN